MEPFLQSSIGKKLFMAITGQVMVLFVLFHVAGNSTIHFSWLNTYAEHLHSLPLLVWLSRLVLFGVFSSHIVFAIWLTLENRRAKPVPYRIKNNQRSTFASRNMIWTGLIIALFLLYHLFHFTVQVINPEFAARFHSDVMGRPDVSRMVVLNFRDLFVSVLYIISLCALFFHLTHGIQSSFQTLGISGDRIHPVIILIGKTAAVLVVTGYLIIPLLVLLGMINV